ncbi:UNVERIFIED_CONTAM: hypothetical protein RMT77_000421 [Armadillidium vulgare]
MKVLRLIAGVTRMDRVRNENVRAGLGVESVLDLVERGQLRWFGHMKRMNEDRYARRFYEWRPEGRRGVGRPRMRWSDCVGTAMERRGKTMEEVEEAMLYDDRGRWRNFVRDG